MKCGRKSNQYIQGPLSSNHGKSWQQVSNAFVGLPVATGKMHFKHDEANEYSTNNLGISINVWITWRQQNAFSAHGVHGTAAHKPYIQKTQEDHAIDGHYIDTLRENYWCYKIRERHTRSICIANTVFFKHKYITMPIISKADAIVAAATHLVQVLKEEILTYIVETSIEQLTRLVKMLQQTTANTTNKWAEQQSIFIPIIHGQMRM